jgi:GNAT superfamily N-acetyltransferase
MGTVMRTTPAVSIRRVRPADGPALAAFYAALGPDSRRARFLGSCGGIDERVAATFCGVDHVHREGFVAVATSPGGMPVIVGHLCLDPLDDGSVEMAVAVADEWRRHGIARRLLTESIAWARRHGIRRMRATMLASNGAILGLLRSIGEPVHLDASDVGIVEAVIDLAPGLAAAA